jgi:hypothetical protein
LDVGVRDDPDSALSFFLSLSFSLAMEPAAREREWEKERERCGTAIGNWHEHGNTPLDI